MNAIRCSSMTAAVLGCSLIAASAGCVSSSTYELAKSHADNAKLLYQNEQRRSQELLANEKRLKQHVEELQASLHDARDKLTRTDKDWRETRDELLRLKIEREQLRQRSRDRTPDLTLHPETDKPALDPETLSRAQGQPEESKRHLKALLQQLQSALDRL